MTALVAEIDKLAAYTGARPSVTAEDIQTLCTPTLQTRVFDLLNAMGKGSVNQALLLYANMLHMKEQPLMILAMLIRQFRVMLLCKCANAKRIKRDEMAKAFGLRPFMVDEALNQARGYSTEKLLAALEDCQDTDLRVKTGRIDAEIGVEILIVKYTVAP
jgi:DNA polymerase-3 subunit delta